MPKTRNFSDPEKRHATNRLNIHDNFNAVHLLRGSAYSSPLAEKAAPRAKCDFVRKGFSLVRQTDNVG